MAEKTPEERVNEKIEKFRKDQMKKAPQEGIVIGKALSFNEMIEELKRKNEEAMDEHKRNGGVCQSCRKHKAEYPNGLNPFHCKMCNEESEVLLKQLSKDPGFVGFKV